MNDRFISFNSIFKHSPNQCILTISFFSVVTPTYICSMRRYIWFWTGLEDQLLAKVVNSENPDLEKQKQKLQEEFNQYKITLVRLEDELLERLANAPEDILSDVPLILGLEATKKTASDINLAIEEGKITELRYVQNWKIEM